MDLGVVTLGGLLLLGIAGSKSAPPSPYSFDLTSGKLTASSLVIDSTYGIDSSGNLDVASATIAGGCSIDGVCTLSDGLTVTGGTHTDTLTVTKAATVSQGLTVTGGTLTDTLSIGSAKIVATTPASARTYTIPDPLTNANFVFDLGLPNLLALPNWSVHQAVVTCASGHNTVFTVPSNRIGLCSSFAITNPTNGDMTYNLEVLINGTYQALTSTSNAALQATAKTPTLLSFFLTTGNSLSVNSSASGLVATFTYILFSSTVPLSTNWVLSDTTTQTLITCPTGVTLVGGAFGSNGIPVTVAPQLFPSISVLFVNTTGIPGNITVNWTPSGGSATVVNLIQIAATTTTSVNLGLCLQPGDLLTVSCDVAGALIFVSTYALPIISTS